MLRLVGSLLTLVTVTMFSTSLAEGWIPNNGYFIGNSYSMYPHLESNLPQVVQDRLSTLLRTGSRLKDSAFLYQNTDAEKAAAVAGHSNAFKFGNPSISCPSFISLQEQSILAGYPDSYWQRQDSINALQDYWAPHMLSCHGSRIALYETWGRRDGLSTYGWSTFEAMNEATIAGYKRYAELLQSKGVETIIVPVAHAYAMVKAENPELFHKLYMTHGSHPAAHGQYLINQVFFSKLYQDASASWQPISDSMWRPKEVSLEDAQYLAFAACRVAFGCKDATCAQCAHQMLGTQNAWVKADISGSLQNVTNSAQTKLQVIV